MSTASPELETVEGRTDRWYRVASEGKGGYLFGDVLSAQGSAMKPLTPEKIAAVRVDATFQVGLHASPRAESLRQVAEATLQALDDREALHPLKGRVRGGR